MKNSTLGFSTLIGKLVEHSITQNNCVIDMESTGHYWYPLYFFLVDNGFHVKVFNPIQTPAFRDVAIRKVKNDNLDSVMISDFIFFIKIPLYKFFSIILYHNTENKSIWNIFHYFLHKPPKKHKKPIEKKYFFFGFYCCIKFFAIIRCRLLRDGTVEYTLS